MPLVLVVEDIGYECLLQKCHCPNQPFSFRPVYAEIIEHVDSVNPRMPQCRHEYAGDHLEGRSRLPKTRFSSLTYTRLHFYKRPFARASRRVERLLLVIQTIRPFRTPHLNFEFWADACPIRIQALLRSREQVSLRGRSEAR
jgi:hypothetical protein